MLWTQKHPRASTEHLGFIPSFIKETDPRPAAEQFADHYAFGGGWMPFKGFTMLPNGNMQYGDPSEEDADPPTLLLWESFLRDETIRVYDSAWVAIVQPDGSFSVSRMD